MISDWHEFSLWSYREQKHYQEKLLQAYITQEIAPFHPYYSKLFKEHGIDPHSIEEREDLQRIPFTTKSDMIKAMEKDRLAFVVKPTPEAIKENWPYARLLPLLVRKLIHGESGVKRFLEQDYLPIFMTATTGRTSDPIPFLYTRHDIERLSQAGARVGDVLSFTSADRGLNVFPYAPHLAFWQVAFAGFESGVFMLSTGGGKTIGTRGNLRMIDKIKPSSIIGVPSYVYHLLRLAQEEKVSLENLRIIVLGAEKVTDTLKDKLRDIALDCGSKEVHVMGTYGFTEAKMAWTECPGGTGYHLYPDMGIFEIVDPDSGKVMGDGESGEIVYSALGAFGTAVLRYRTNDYAEGGITHEPCPACGRKVPRLSSKITRLSNQTDLKLTKVKGTLVDLNHIGAILSDIHDIEEWQVEISKANDDPDGFDEVIIYVALAEGCDIDSDKLIADIRSATEIAPSKIVKESIDKLNERTGLETEMKETRFLDRR